MNDPQLAGKHVSETEFQQKIKDRAIRLFTYLQELVQLRTPQIRDVENYEAVIWFSEIPHEDECYSISWGAPLDDSDVWLEIKKRKEPVCPALPTVCRGWIDPRELLKSEGEPRLLDRIFAPSEKQKEEISDNQLHSGEAENGQWVFLAERPEVSEAWNNYLGERWRPWSEKHRRWLSVHSIYGRLFTIFQLQRNLGETYEYMLGLGLLTWSTNSGQTVRRHILAGQASLEFDSNTGMLSARPAADGVKLGLEMDMLEPSERPNAEQVLALEKSLENTAESPWDRGCIDPILRSWIHSLHSEGIYDGQDERPSSINQMPKVTFAPAMFLRKRTSRSLVGSFRAIIEQIKNGEEVPLGVRKLLELEIPQAESMAEANQQTAIHHSETEEIIHFPLPVA